MAARGGDDDAPPPSFESRRVERAAWAWFLHQARQRTCGQCLHAGGAWLRGEPWLNVGDAPLLGGRRVSSAPPMVAREER